MKKSVLSLLLLTTLISCGKKKSPTTETPFILETQGELSSPSYEKYASVLNVIDSKYNYYDTNDLRYNQAIVLRNKELKNLNYQNFEKGLREIHIYGSKLELGINKTQKFYDLINKATDVSKLILHAEVIVVSDPIEVHSADIEIKAKKLVFEGMGSISTRPISLKYPANQFQNGENGLNGGSVKLFVESIESSLPVIRIITDGGDGQAAGPGQDGARGPNASIVYGSNYHSTQVWKCHSDGPAGGRFKAMNCDWHNGKSGRPSGNGSNARVGGRAGLPGAAGIIYTTVSKEDLFSMKGGQAGAMDAKRFGGAPGEPARTCRGKVKGSNVTSYDCVIAVAGQDAQPQIIEIDKGLDGYVSLMEKSPGIWISDEVIRSKFAYAKDIYLAGNSLFALNLFNELLELKTIKTFNPTLTSELNVYLDRIGAHKDIFGNERAWVPNLALEINYSLFKKEVERSINLMVLTNQLIKKMENIEKNSNDLRLLQKTYFEKIDSNANEISDLVRKTVGTNEIIADLEMTENEFQFELRKLESEIIKNAKNNFKVPFMDKAVKVFSAISKTIPVGQPTFGIIGNGVEFFHNSTNGSMTKTEIFSQLPSLVDSFQQVNLDNSLKELSTKVKGLDPARLSNLKTLKEKMAYLNEVRNFTNPILDSVTKQMAEFKSREVSRSALESEINKIKRSHKMYQKVVAKLEELLLKKETFVRLAQQIMNDIGSVTAEIHNDYEMIAYLYEDFSDVYNVNYLGFAEQLKEIYRRSANRIDYYQYLLTKSYEHRFLVPAPLTTFISHRLDNILNPAKGLVNNTQEIDSKTTEDLIQELSVEHQSALGTIILAITDNYENSDFIKQVPLEVSLTRIQLDQINEGKDVYLDLTDKEFFGKNKENVRLENVEVLNIQGENHFTASPIEVTVSHSGKSIIDQGGKDFYFEQINSNITSNWVWTSIYNPRTRNMYNSEVHISETLMLSTLLDSNFVIAKPFTSPGARTFLKINVSKDQNTKITDMILKLTVSYKNK